MGTCPGPNPYGYISEGWETVDTSQKRGLEGGAFLIAPTPERAHSLAS